MSELTAPTVNEGPKSASFLNLLGGCIAPVALMGAFVLYLHNVQLGGYCALEGTIGPLWVTCLGATLLYLLFALLTRNVNRATLIAVAAALSVFDVAMTLHLTFPGMALLYICAAFSLFVLFAPFDLTSLRKGATFIALFFLAMQIQIILARAITFNCWVWPRTNWQIVPSEVSNASPPKSQKPDIYYIITDTMPSQSVLENYYGLKDKSFDNFLKEEGFYVAEESHSNYPFTLMSIPSSLSMTLLNQTTTAMKDSAYAYDMSRFLMQNPRVALSLKHFGYRFINVGSGWANTNFLWQADKNMRWSPLDENFLPCIYGMLVNSPTNCGLYLDYIRSVRLDIFKTLAQSSHEQGPKFVFCHMLMPHVPCVFTADGQPTDGGLKYTQSGAESKLFLGQALFCQKKLKEVIKKILAQPGPKPIIVIQGDHGPASTGDVAMPVNTWSDKFIRERFGILNAYYLPGKEKIGLYQTITPVNSFRLIFNHYFGTQFELQDDRSFAVSSASPFKFREITDILKGKNSDTVSTTSVPVKQPYVNPLSQPDLD